MANSYIYQDEIIEPGFIQFLFPLQFLYKNISLLPKINYLCADFEKQMNKNARQILARMIEKGGATLPELADTLEVSIGTVMRNLGFESKDHSNVPFYKVVPLQAA